MKTRPTGRSGTYEPTTATMALASLTRLVRTLRSSAKWHPLAGEQRNHGLQDLTAGNAMSPGRSESTRKQRGSAPEGAHAAGPRSTKTKPMELGNGQQGAASG